MFKRLARMVLIVPALLSMEAAATSDHPSQPKETPAMSKRDGAAPQHACCDVLELRQYTLKPGRRDALIALFDRHFVESQEATGMTVLGQFRDRRRSDRFVWIRGFSGMESRHAALERFYGGPVWAVHKDAANETMVDSDDVLLLRPARPETAFRLNPGDRPKVGEERTPSVGVVAGLHALRQPADHTMVSAFERTVTPVLREHGVGLEALLVTESAPNTFTRLPVREGEQLLVWFGTLTRNEMFDARRLVQAIGGLDVPGHEPPVILELEPTPRSLLGHHRSGR